MDKLLPESRQLLVLLRWLWTRKELDGFFVLPVALCHVLAELILRERRVNERFIHLKENSNEFQVRRKLSTSVYLWIDQRVRHYSSHQFSHVVKVHQHAAILVAVFCSSLVVVRVTATAVMLAKVQQQSQEQPRHHRL